MVWREQIDHHSDCTSARLNYLDFFKKNKSKIVFLNCQSALKPVFHNLGISLPVPIPPAKSDIENEGAKKTNVSSAESSADKMYVADVDEKKLHLFSHLKLNGLVRDLSLTKEKKQSY